ncbi:DUF2524 family protein [Halalkalibacter urbisdiaboli]|uniref:DUF2524 family protein n=1 Tax=Halalkalibacter urbisdiaboli TaxID=1960589 RepID=UPI0013FD28F8|nr:DUF2524 family protein [Halalkalibacter urbisdiaboli]
MTERTQMKEMLQKAEEVMEVAQKALEDSHRINEGDPMEYSNAQLELEHISEDLDALMHAATPEQRYELERTQQQIRQLQNNMILKQ